MPWCCASVSLRCSFGADRTRAAAGQREDHIRNRTSLHKVRGDSVPDAGILEGDLVAVEHNAPSGPGDIVVAVVDGELTVTTLRRDAEDKFYLEAANPAYEPIRPKTSMEILGVVVSVCRRVRR